MAGRSAAGDGGAAWEVAVTARMAMECHGACPYCDARGGQGGRLGAEPGTCRRSESTLVYPRRAGRAGGSMLVVTWCGRAVAAVRLSADEPDPWSPAALLRAAFAGRLGSCPPV